MPVSHDAVLQEFMRLSVDKRYLPRPLVVLGMCVTRGHVPHCVGAGADSIDLRTIQPLPPPERLGVREPDEVPVIKKDERSFGLAVGRLVARSHQEKVVLRGRRVGVRHADPEDHLPIGPLDEYPRLVRRIVADGALPCDAIVGPATPAMGVTPG